ncbi:MAG: hypothetical protein IJW96_03595 [Clostridia bacterium]|nr:hypothetical protein [Clostridia bacterium]
MGKKKSTILMVLLTIVMVVLLFITAFPTMTIPFTDGVKIWNPAVTQYDLGAELGGGYYAYYYPTGVISETEFKELDAEDQKSYTQWKGLYLNNDPDFGIIDETEEDENANGIVDKFEETFAAATKEITARYAEKGYSDYRVAVVDDFALRVQVPASEESENMSAFNSACITFERFSKTGGMTITLKGSEVSQLEDKEVTDIIKGFSLYERYDMVFIRATFTELGKEMLNEFAYEVEAAKAASSASSSSSAEEVVLSFMVGDEAVIELKEDYMDNGYLTTSYELRYPIGNASEKAYAETVMILLNSALNNAEGFDIEFTAIPTSAVRTFGSIYGELTMTLLYVSLFAVLVALSAYAVVTMGKYGVVGVYANASYLIVTGICFAFITTGVYEITLGTALVFVLGLVLMNVIHAYTYRAIKSEFANGKTAFSAVKNGYNKNIWLTVDVYAVLLLGALALLIGAAGLGTLATQALICIVTGAFCNLLWTRVINYMFLSASNDKYKYFRVVREDNDND